MNLPRPGFSQQIGQVVQVLSGLICQLQDLLVEPHGFVVIQRHERGGMRGGIGVPPPLRTGPMWRW
jgi:hypothetical protein